LHGVFDGIKLALKAEYLDRQGIRRVDELVDVVEGELRLAALRAELTLEFHDLRIHCLDVSISSAL
jgi:hypothetical protein